MHRTERLGTVLRELRTVRQLTLQTVAARLGISFSSLAMYERGERVPPLPRLQALADFYGIGLERLLGRSGPEQPRIEDVPAFLRATGEVSDETIRGVMALLYRQRGMP